MRTRRRQPPDRRNDFRIWMRTDEIDRLEALCLRRTARDPRNEALPSRVARLAILKYLEEAEAREGKSWRKRPPCVYADCVGGLRWCPEHGASWREGQEVPETCRGDE